MNSNMVPIQGQMIEVVYQPPGGPDNWVRRLVSAYDVATGDVEVIDLPESVLEHGFAPTAQTPRRRVPHGQWRTLSALREALDIADTREALDVSGGSEELREAIDASR